MWKANEAVLALVAMSFLWGLTIPLIRVAVQDFDPHTFVTVRFTLASLTLAPFLLLNRNLRSQTLQCWPIFLTVGAVAFLIFFTQTLGLKTVPSPRAAFITGSYVILVPLLAPFFERRYPAKLEVVGALVVTLGLFLLVDPQFAGISGGDVLIFLAALFIAVHIHIIQRFARRGLNDWVFSFVQILGVCFYGWLMLPLFPPHGVHLNGSVLVALAICGWLVTLGTFWIQSHYQKHVSTERAAVIFSLEPVFATLIGYLWLKESLPLQGCIGALIIVTAILVIQLTGNSHPMRSMDNPSDLRKNPTPAAGEY